jgi:hypothetical protein
VLDKNLVAAGRFERIRLAIRTLVSS